MIRPQALPFPTLDGGTPAQQANAERPHGTRRGRRRDGGKIRFTRPDPARIARLKLTIERMLAEARAGRQAKAEGRKAAGLRGLETIHACLAVTANPRLRQALVVEAERLLAAIGGGSASGRRRAVQCDRQPRHAPPPQGSRGATGQGDDKTKRATRQSRSGATNLCTQRLADSLDSRRPGMF